MIGYIVIIAIMIVAAADRFLLHRRAITDLSLGELELTRNAIRAPFQFTPARKRLRGAAVSYLFRDANHPTTVIYGRSRPLEVGCRGETSEYLYVSLDKIHSPGTWVMSVTVTHGDSLWNPLYRIFPTRYQFSRTFIISNLGE